MQRIVIGDLLLRLFVILPQHCVEPNISLVVEYLLGRVAFCRERQHEIVAVGRDSRTTLQRTSVDIDCWVATLDHVIILHGGEG